MEVDRTTAEKMYLGAVVYDSAILASCQLTDKMFTKYRVVFTAVVELSGRTHVDGESFMLLVREGLDAQTIAEVQEHAWTSAHWELYHKAIFKAWAQDTVKDALKLAGMQNYPENLDTVERVMTAVMLHETGSKTKRIGDLVDHALDRIRGWVENRGKIPGISFGLSAIDRATLGAQESQLLIIGARPSQGKSALMVQIAKKMALNGVRVGIVTVESSENEVVMRMLTSQAGLDGRKVSMGMLSTSDLQSLKDSSIQLRDLRDNILIHDQSTLRLAQAQTVIRKMVRDGAKVIFVDYLQLIRVPGKEKRSEEVSEVSTSLKALARELKVPIVALAQLGRDSDDKRPGMGDFQHSSQIEQDADQCWLIWHKHDSNGQVTESRIILAKVRDGQTKDVVVKFDRPKLTFYEIVDDREP